MAFMEIVQYGNAALREQARPVKRVTDDIRVLVRDMLKAMRANNGLGLAAEQVGRNEAICVIDIPEPAPDEAPATPPAAPPLPMPLAMINPRIVTADGKQTDKEGCLSFPEIFVNITRARRVTAVYTDLDGNEQTVEAEGLAARAIQHELDHLNGVLLVDRMSNVQRIAMAGKLRRLRQQNGDAA